MRWWVQWCCEGRTTLGTSVGGESGPNPGRDDHALSQKQWSSERTGWKVDRARARWMMKKTIRTSLLSAAAAISNIRGKRQVGWRKEGGSSSIWTTAGTSNVGVWLTPWGRDETARAPVVQGESPKNPRFTRKRPWKTNPQAGREHRISFQEPKGYISSREKMWNQQIQFYSILQRLKTKLRPNEMSTWHACMNSSLSALDPACDVTCSLKFLPPQFPSMRDCNWELWAK